jgi:hypothetical protein
MRHFQILLLWVVFINLTKEIASEVEYYWKEYAGVIPPDALPGGRDLDGRNTYIGQAYIHGHGLYVAQIFPGKNELDVPCYGVKKADKDIKILCTKHADNFEWITTSNKYFHVNMTNKLPVPGGYESVGNKGLLNIGRLTYQGVLKVGRVTSYELENAKLFFTHSNIEKQASFYQVLNYRGLPIYDVTPRIK